jgi:hypothetical protein
LDDPSTAGTGYFGTVIRVAKGITNGFDDRWGDDLVIQPNQPCNKWFTASNYALDNNGINQRYVEFGSKSDRQCWLQGTGK